MPLCIASAPVQAVNAVHPLHARASQSPDYMAQDSKQRVNHGRHRSHSAAQNTARCQRAGVGGCQRSVGEVRSAEGGPCAIFQTKAQPAVLCPPAPTMWRPPAGSPILQPGSRRQRVHAAVTAAARAPQHKHNQAASHSATPLVQLSIPKGPHAPARTQQRATRARKRMPGAAQSLSGARTAPAA